LAENAVEFVSRLDQALKEDSPQRAAERKALAKQHTWKNRYNQIIRDLADSVPRATIIIITYNNLALTKLCIESILRNTEYLNYEVVVVDNKSTDGTPAYLQELAALQQNLRLILNDQNHGFARANNQGIQSATGDYLVLLNNDTVVSPGWLSRLL